jgi:AcrR family transcriptional regulator
MRRVASALGIATMSLYNYVPAKDHLVQLMVDQLAGEYSYPAAPADQRQAIAELARQGRDIARRHPWLAGLLHRPSPPGPNGLRYLDYFPWAAGRIRAGYRGEAGDHRSDQRLRYDVRRHAGRAGQGRLPRTGAGPGHSFGLRPALRRLTQPLFGVLDQKVAHRDATAFGLGREPPGKLGWEHDRAAHAVVALPAFVAQLRQPASFAV